MSYTQSCSASLQSKRAILWLGALPSFSMAVGLFHKVLGAVSARFVASSLLLLPFMYLANGFSLHCRGLFGHDRICVQGCDSHIGFGARLQGTLLPACANMLS